MGGGTSALLEVSKQLDMTNEERLRYRTYYLQLEKLGKNPKQIVSQLEEKLVEERKNIGDKPSTANGNSKNSSGTAAGGTKVPVKTVPRVPIPRQRQLSLDKQPQKPPASTAATEAPVKREVGLALGKVSSIGSEETVPEGLLSANSDANAKIDESMFSRLDSNQVECKLCKAVFSSFGQFERHVKYSQMHQRLAKEFKENESKNDRAAKIAKWVHDILSRLKEKEWERTLASKPVAIQRWIRAVHKVMQQNRTERTKQMLYRHYAVDLGRTPFHADNVLYQGNKFFWRSQDTIEIHLYLHDPPDSIDEIKNSSNNSNRKLVEASNSNDINRGNSSTFGTSAPPAAVTTARQPSSLVSSARSVSNIRVLEVCGFNHVSRREVQRLLFDYNALLEFLREDIKQAHNNQTKLRRRSFGDGAVNVHKITKDIVVNYVLPRVEVVAIPGKAACQQFVLMNPAEIPRLEKRPSAVIQQALLEDSKMTNGENEDEGRPTLSNGKEKLLGASSSMAALQASKSILNSEAPRRNDSTMGLMSGGGGGTSNLGSTIVEIASLPGFRPVDIIRRPTQPTSLSKTAATLDELAHQTHEISVLMSKAAKYAGLTMTETVAHPLEAALGHMLHHQHPRLHGSGGGGDGNGESAPGESDAKLNGTAGSPGEEPNVPPVKKFLLLTPEKRKRRKSM